MTPIEITYNTPVPIEITLLGVGTKGDKGIQGIPGATYNDTEIRSQLAEKVNKSDLFFNVKDYGAKGDGTTDDTVSIQTAINTATALGGTIFFPYAKYKTSSELVINYGGTYKPVYIEGNGSIIYYVSSSGNCLRINPVSSNALLGLSDLKISNLILDASMTGSNIGLSIGTTDKVIDNFAWSVIKNVMIVNFETNIFITGLTRHISFINVVSRTPSLKGLDINGTNNFTGDLNFLFCEIQGGTHSTVHLHAYHATVLADIRGLHFNNCIFYGANTSPRTIFLETGGYGRVLDMFFNACALDQGHNIAYEISNSANGIVGAIHINDGYILGFTIALKIANNTTRPNAIFFINNNVSADKAFDIVAANTIKICNNDFTDITTKSVIDYSSNVHILGNTFNGAATDYCVYFGSNNLSSIVKNNFGKYTTDFLQNASSLVGTSLINSENLLYV